MERVRAFHTHGHFSVFFVRTRNQAWLIIAGGRFDWSNQILGRPDPTSDAILVTARSCGSPNTIASKRAQHGNVPPTEQAPTLHRTFPARLLKGRARPEAEARPKPAISQHPIPMRWTQVCPLLFSIQLALLLVAAKTISHSSSLIFYHGRWDSAPSSWW